MTPDPIFGSHGSESLFRALQPHSSAGNRQFPVRTPVPRFKDASDLHKWVEELVRLKRPPEIEPGILVFADVTWKGTFVLPGEVATRYALASAALHAVIATNPEDSIAAAITEGRSAYQYFRLDYAPDKLGPLFKEPAPHVHIVVDGEPRFAACRTKADLPIADFVDFLLRNYRYKEWARWLHEEWFTRFVQDEEDDIFELIDIAFRGAEGGSNLRFLRRPETRTVLTQLRQVLIDEKLSRCPLSIDPELWGVVAA